MEKAIDFKDANGKSYRLEHIKESGVNSLTLFDSNGARVDCATYDRDKDGRVRLVDCIEFKDGFIRKFYFTTIKPHWFKWIDCIEFKETGIRMDKAIDFKDANGVNYRLEHIKESGVKMLTRYEYNGEPIASVCYDREKDGRLRVVSHFRTDKAKGTATKIYLTHVKESWLKWVEDIEFKEPRVKSPSLDDFEYPAVSEGGLLTLKRPSVRLPFMLVTKRRPLKAGLGVKLYGGGSIWFNITRRKRLGLILQMFGNFKRKTLDARVIIDLRRGG